MSATAPETQGTLLDLDAKEINPSWIDDKQPLLVPVNPLHAKTHRLQVLLARLDKQAANNPAQFNSKNYIDTLNALARCWERINAGEITDDESDGTDSGNNQGGLAEVRRSGEPGAVGDRITPRVGTGISADNPFTG